LLRRGARYKYACEGSHARSDAAVGSEGKSEKGEGDSPTEGRRRRRKRGDRRGIPIPTPAVHPEGRANGGKWGFIAGDERPGGQDRSRLAGLLAKETGKEDKERQERARERENRDRRSVGSRGVRRIDSDESEDSSGPDRSRSKDREGERMDKETGREGEMARNSGSRGNEKEIVTVDVEEEEEEGEDMTEETPVPVPEVAKKRPPGRPPTMGEYSRLAEKRERAGSRKKP